MRLGHLMIVCALLCCTAHATTRLVLIGGGDHPKLAMDRFATWAGGREAKILIIAWATSDPQGATGYLTEEFLGYHPTKIDAAPTYEEMGAKKDAFLKTLAAATGVFFSGGDQNRVMDVLKDGALLSALRKRYAEGAVFGGTSAGTAIMSRTMITGNGDFLDIDAAKVETREGLGLVEDVVLDQHFLKRQRQNRLFSVLLRGRERVGLGIDEGGAVAIEDGVRAEVIGPKLATLIEVTGDNKFSVEIIAPGKSFDLKK